MNEIKVKSNNILDIVPTDVLIALYRYFDSDKTIDYKEYLNKKDDIFQELKNRYFKNYDFNFYETIFIQNNNEIGYFSKFNFLKYMETLNYELIQPNTTIKSEYISSFCDVLISFFSTINNSTTIEINWDFSQATKIINILNNLKKGDLRNDNQIIRINNIIDIINSSIVENKKLPEEKKEISSITFIKNDNQLVKKNLKIIKSKLKKCEMENILKEITRYDKSEQIELISYAIKKWDSDILYSLPNYVLFSFLIEHPVERFSPLTFLYNKFSNNPKSFISYMGYNNFDDFFKFVKDYYIFCDGTTEFGSKCYLISLANTLYDTNCDNIRVENVDFLMTNFIIPIIEKLKKFRGKNIEGIYEEIEVNSFFINLSKESENFFLKSLYFKNGNYNYEEKNIYETTKIPVYELVISLIKIMHKFNIMNNEMLFLNFVDFVSYSDKYKEYISTFEDIIKSFTITESDFKFLNDKLKNNNSSLISYIQLYFCNHREINPDIAYLFIKNLENVKLSSKLFCIHNCSGSYHSNYDFFIRIFLLALNKLNFANYDDCKVAFYAEFSTDELTRKISIHNGEEFNYSLLDLFINKFKKESFDIYNVIHKYANTIQEFKIFIKIFNNV